MFNYECVQVEISHFSVLGAGFKLNDDEIAPKQLRICQMQPTQPHLNAYLSIGLHLSSFEIIFLTTRSSGLQHPIPIPWPFMNIVHCILNVFQ